MKIIFILFIGIQVANNLNAQITLSSLKHYVSLSPSELDQTLSRIGFSFESSKKNEDSSGMQYKWRRDKDKPSIQELRWAWAKEDTAPMFQENTNKYMGYADQVTRRVLFISLSPSVYNSVLNELSNDKSYKKEDESTINAIQINFESKNWLIFLSKYRQDEKTRITYSIVVKERYTVTYQMHYLDHSIKTNKKINLGESAKP